jgi:cbb3-type cytochrome oxidase cytochrome c subunit/mono/diheme cytochrome c family protein
VREAIAAVEAKIEANLRVLDVLESEHRWKEEHGWKEVEYVDFPMLPRPYVEGQCLKCHGSSIVYTPDFRTSEALVQHEVEDDRHGLVKRDAKGDVVYRTRKDAQGRPLADAAGNPIRKRRPAPKPVWGTASDVDGRWRPETFERGVATMLDHGCQGCHLIKDFGKHPGFPRRTSDDRGADFSTPSPGSLSSAGTRRVGPDVTHIRDKTTEDWTVRWILNPNAYRIDTRMPSFYLRREHDDDYRVVYDGDKPRDRTVVVDADASDLAQMDVEASAIAKYLFSASRSRADRYVEPPPGDPKRGSRDFYTVGCYACHVGAGRWDEDRGEWIGDDAVRKVAPVGLLPGPRLTSLGSKTNAKWLDAWLAEPRHYWSTTNMPNMRFRDELDKDGKTVVRSAAQSRADVVAYLLRFRDAAFESTELPEKRWTALHDVRLFDFWMEWFGKGQDPAVYRGGSTVAEAEKFANERPREAKLLDVGRRLVAHRGCFGCHNVEPAVFATMTPIGKELTEEGSQDIHKFDFGMLKGAHVTDLPVADPVPETRWHWIEQKLRDPRIFDRYTHKPRWTDRLRMPLFNITSADRTAVTAVVLGLVKEPVKAEAKYRPNDVARRLAAGRAVIERYNCQQCHPIEGREGYVRHDQISKGADPGNLPPNLFSQGNRTRSEWLFRFLKAPFDLRPAVAQRMPMFRMTDEEALALVDYFAALAERADRLSTDPEDAPLPSAPYESPVTIDYEVAGQRRQVVVGNLVEETQALFETMNCNRCHLAKGTPGADPNEGGIAPPFTLAGARLRRDWVRDLLDDPQNQIQGTKMVQFWPFKAARQWKPGATRSLNNPEFLCGARGSPNPTVDQVAAAQMDALTRYVLYHYRPSVLPATAPPEPAPAGDAGSGK